MADADLADLARTARRAAVLAAVCVCVAVLVLALDQQIKRHILSKVAEAKDILARFEKVAADASGRAGDAMVGASPPGGGDTGSQPGHSVGEPAAPGEAVDKAAGDGHMPGSRVRSRKVAGTPGDA